MPMLTERCASVVVPADSYAGDSLPCVKTLLEFGANVEHTDYEGRTALMQAAQHGSAPIIRELLHAGANPARRIHSGPDRGMTAAAIAERHRCGECAQILRDAATHVPTHSEAVERRRIEVEAALRSAMHTYQLWWPSHYWAKYVRGFSTGDECALHRALDRARATPGADGALVAEGQALRSRIDEAVMDVLERRHVCEEVPPLPRPNSPVCMHSMHKVNAAFRVWYRSSRTSSPTACLPSTISTRWGCPISRAPRSSTASRRTCSSAPSRTPCARPSARSATARFSSTRTRRGACRSTRRARASPVQGASRRTARWDGTVGRCPQLDGAQLPTEHGRTVIGIGR